MKRSILVTGVSGTGKSTVSKKLNEMGYKAYDMDDYPNLFMMVDKETGQPVVDHDNADLKKVMGMDWICDKEKLKSLIENESSETAFYCGSASNLNDLLPLFDLVIMLTVGHEATRHRLTSRTENDFGQTAEVQDWVLSWKDWWEDEMKDKGVIVIDAHKSVDDVAKEIIKKAKQPA